MRPGTPKRRKPIARRSSKASRRARKRVRFKAEVLADRELCEAQVVIECGRLATDLHEVLPRSRGGDNLDPGNVLPVCRLCHAWIGDHPDWARDLGLLR
ncbi:MAG: hypothetical protein OXF27_07590 [Acidobacteria bacterium]|nr:hypothetical protein [Acidobacteriota bacterium]